MFHTRRCVKPLLACFLTFALVAQRKGNSFLMRMLACLGILLLGFAALALAAQPILVVPFTFDPGHTGIIVSGWQPGAGEPGDANDVAQHGFVLEKNGATNTDAAAGAVLKGVAGLSADGVAKLDLGYDIKDNTHCGAGAPRFNVSTTGGGFFFVGGCSNGSRAPAASGWTRVTFDCALGQWFNVSTGAAGCPASGSTVIGAAILFDEGSDTPPSSLIVTPGQTVIDNITVNGNVVGKPGDGPK